MSVRLSVHHQNLSNLKYQVCLISDLWSIRCLRALKSRRSRRSLRSPRFIFCLFSCNHIIYITWEYKCRTKNIRINSWSNTQAVASRKLKEAHTYIYRFLQTTSKSFLPRYIQVRRQEQYLLLTPCKCMKDPDLFLKVSSWVVSCSDWIMSVHVHAVHLPFTRASRQT